jgi:hypothetical protein
MPAGYFSIAIANVFDSRAERIENEEKEAA